MPDPSPDPARALFQEAFSLRQRFADLTAPHRPDLHRYCLRLTGDLWDAEDLVQEALARAYAKVAEIHQGVREMRPYLFRIATNAWIDRTRRHRADPLEEEPAGDAPSPDEGARVGEALAGIAARLAPQERAAILLKDVFGFSLEEAADFLETTTGAVKAALHRGRGRLRDPAPVRRPSPPSALVDDFVRAFNARDLDGLVRLMTLDARAEVVGVVQEYGRESTRGSLGHTVKDDELLRAGRSEFKGEPIVLLWYRWTKEGEPAEVVRDVLRLEAREGLLARLRYYYFCPETLGPVCADLGVPLRDNGYRYGG